MKEILAIIFAFSEYQLWNTYPGVVIGCIAGMVAIISLRQEY